MNEIIVREFGGTASPRIAEIQKMFGSLDRWCIILGMDIDADGSPYTDHVCIDVDRKKAMIYPWHDEDEPGDYLLHEMLHIAFAAAGADKEAEELAVQDLCILIRERTP